MLGVSDRTVRNWEGGATRPPPDMALRLREELGDFDSEGDPVEAAVRKSELTEDRQYDVIGYYKRRLREQREDQGQVS